MKKLISILVALGLLVTMLAGCHSDAGTQQQSQQAETSSAQTGKTVITITSAYTLPCFEEAIETLYADIDLQVEVLATAIINGEVTRRLRNDHGSDLIITNLPAGEIADYTCDLSAEAFVENYQSSIMKSISVDGQNRYLPLPGAYYGYIINKTILDELGLELPETRADMLGQHRIIEEKAHSF